MYPNAKVILTERDPLKWYNSVKNTITQIQYFVNEPWLALPLRMVKSLKGTPVVAARFSCIAPTYLGPKYPGGLFGAVDKGQDTALLFHKNWNDQVKTEIPEDKLLVLGVEEGWRPIGSFLGLPVPEDSFPRANDTTEQVGSLVNMKRISIAMWSFIFDILGVVGYYVVS